jgi:orotate phosphoribosyltransferase
MVELSENLLETWERCRGYYDCPKRQSGERTGPLVAYAGTYVAADGSKQHYVGDKYYNFAFVEEHPDALNLFGENLAAEIATVDLMPTYVLGAFMGGVLLGEVTAFHLGCRYGFPEKKVLVAGTEERKEESDQILGRHRPVKGDRVLIAEDVCNNLSTTEKLDRLVESVGAEVVGIACALNRSGRLVWVRTDGKEVPISTTLFIPTEQYKQDDPFVAKDVEARNICWDPKKHWDWLLGQMYKDKLKEAV